jgi:anti-anti-sigma regulatory factor
VVLNLDQVTFCNSSGLGALVAIWKAARAHDGDRKV